MSSRRKSAKPIKYVPADHKHPVEHPSVARRPNDTPVAEPPFLRRFAWIKNEGDSPEKVTAAVEKVGVSKRGTASARERAADDHGNQDCSEAEKFPLSRNSSEVASPPQSNQDARLETAKVPRRRKSAKPLKFVPEPAEGINVCTYCNMLFFANS